MTGERGIEKELGVVYNRLRWGQRLSQALTTSLIMFDAKTQLEAKGLSTQTGPTLDLDKPKTPQPFPSWIGKTVLGYEICGYAGRGGYGTVWIGKNASGQFHAVKIVEVPQTGSHHGAAQEFRGVHLLKEQIPTHPHLIQIHVLELTDERLIYSMELGDSVRGEMLPSEKYQPDTLAGRIQNRRLTLAETKKVILDILSGLRALHSKGLVHRDLKPQNIVFVSGVPKLADIGLASLDHTALSTAGTVGYLPLDGSKGPDADLYALGKIVYECVTGLSASDFPTLPNDLIQGEHRERIRYLNHFLVKACATQRNQRFQNAQEFEQGFLAALSPKAARKSKRWLQGASLGFMVVVMLVVLVVQFRPKHSTVENPPEQTNLPVMGKPTEQTNLPVMGKPEIPDGKKTNPPKVGRTKSAWIQIEKLLSDTKASASAKQNVKSFVLEFEKKNPEWEGEIYPEIADEKIRGIRITPTGLRDLSAVRNLPHLWNLDCSYKGNGVRGDLETLEHLRGLIFLQTLKFQNHKIKDLAPLENIRFVVLDCGNNYIESLEPLRTSRLRILSCQGNPIRSLEPLGATPIVDLNVKGCFVDLNPILHLPLTNLSFDETPDTRKQANQILTLKTINGVPKE